MKKLTVLIFLFTGYCFHAVEPSQPVTVEDLMKFAHTVEELLKFAHTAIQNNGKAIGRLADSLDRKLNETKTELRNEIQAQILTLSNRLFGKIQEVKETVNDISVRQKGSEKSLETFLTILIKKAAVSESQNSTAIMHKIIVENRSSLDTLLLNDFNIELRDKEWITIQRRGTPLTIGKTREKFHSRSWTEYENGFGSQDGDFWIGLQKMHHMTRLGFTELRVELEDWDGNTAYASYKVFKVAGSWDNYRLTVSGYSGTAGDSMDYHNEEQFSTVDRDHDNAPWNCAVLYGAWWHAACSQVHLNIEYQNQGQVEKWQGIRWSGWKGEYYSLKKTEMKLRRPA